MSQGDTLNYCVATVFTSKEYLELSLIFLLFFFRIPTLFCFCWQYETSQTDTGWMHEKLKTIWFCYHSNIEPRMLWVETQEFTRTQGESLL